MFYAHNVIITIIVEWPLSCTVSHNKLLLIPIERGGVTGHQKQHRRSVINVLWDRNKGYPLCALTLWKG